MKQLTKVKYEKKTWTVKALIPVDFLEQSYWPFSYYKFKDDSFVKKTNEIKRDWKLKPKEKIDEEARLKNALRHALRVGAGIADDELADVEENKQLYNILFHEIYALTYNLTKIEKIFTPQKVISKDFAELLAIKAKAMNVEPYSFMTDISKEAPEMINPKRYDFNFFILGAGWDRERAEVEKAQAQMRKQHKRAR